MASCRLAVVTGCAKLMSMTTSVVGSTSSSSSACGSETGGRRPKPGSRRPDGEACPPIRGSCSRSGKCSCIFWRTRLSCHQLNTTTTRISTTPRRIKPICKSLIVSLAVSPNVYPYPPSDFGQLQGGINVDRDDPRNTLFLHGNANKLLGHLHGNFIVRNEKKLRLLAHAADQVCISFRVGVIQWRVDLVEQAKWRGVQLEQRKHQRRGGQRLFAPGQQVDSAVALAGRLSHDLHTRIQDLVAGDNKLGLPAAKKLGEQLAKMMVDRIEGSLQQLARLAIDVA